MRSPFRRRPTGAIRVTDVKRLDLAPGDKLVITCPEELTGEDAQRIVDAFERFAPGTSIAVLDCGRDVSVLSPTPTSVPARHRRLYVLAPNKDQALAFAERWAASAPGRSALDIQHVATLADVAGILPDAEVVEVEGAHLAPLYTALCNALSAKGARFFSDGTTLTPEDRHPLPLCPPPPPKDPGIPTRHGPGA